MLCTCSIALRAGCQPHSYKRHQCKAQTSEVCSVFAACEREIKNFMVGTSTDFLSFSEKNEAARNERGGWALASLGRFGANG